MRFVKMEALGNDFVVVDGRVTVDSGLVRRLCDRRRGIGADGLLQVGIREGIVAMGYWNGDGSAAEMCGNGLRCVTRYAFESGLVEGKEFVVATPAGKSRVRYGKHPRVELGEAELGARMTFRGLEFLTVRVGNPHAVTFVPDIGSAEVGKVGPALEAETAGGINVEFARVVDRSRIEMRVWERGVGETLACGSGMVAVAVAANDLGMTETTVTVAVPGGEGDVELAEDTTWLTGPAEYVFRGEIDL